MADVNKFFVSKLNNACSGSVLHNCLLHLLLKNGDFLTTDISQSSVAARLVFGEVFIIRHCDEIFY